MKKVCINCKKERPIERFDKREKSKDGYRNHCRECMYKKRRQRFDTLSDEKQKELKNKKKESSKRSLKLKMQDPEFRIRQKIKRRKIHLRRLENDPLYKLRIAYVRRLNKCMKRLTIKNMTFLENLGCSLDEFKIYLEQRFESWMNWNNYGKYNGELNYGWDLDHIVPISTARTEEEFYKLSHYTNLQPLCSKVNRDIKKDKIENPQ